MPVGKQYHFERERQCKEMARKATQPGIRDFHDKLAELHRLKAIEDEFDTDRWASSS